MNASPRRVIPLVALGRRVQTRAGWCRCPGRGVPGSRGAEPVARLNARGDFVWGVGRFRGFRGPPTAPVRSGTRPTAGSGPVPPGQGAPLPLTPHRSRCSVRRGPHRPPQNHIARHPIATDTRPVCVTRAGDTTTTSAADETVPGACCHPRGSRTARRRVRPVSSDPRAGRRTTAPRSSPRAVGPSAQGVCGGASPIPRRGRPWPRFDIARPTALGAPWVGPTGPRPTGGVRPRSGVAGRIVSSSGVPALPAR